jgi:hypothetical protein
MPIRLINICGDQFGSYASVAGETRNVALCVNA